LGNSTKIKYLKVTDKIYEVIKISFFYMSIEAVETELSVDDVPENEIWDIVEFKHYKVKLINNNGAAEIINIEKWKTQNGR
jgi:hypothetical protein